MQGTAPSGTGPANGDPGQDVPGALIGGILLAGAPSTTPVAPAADFPAAAPPSPWGPPAGPSSPHSQPLPDFGTPESHFSTEVEDGEGGRVAAEALGEEEAEARAALVAEEFEVATQVPVPEEGVGDVAAGSRPAGTQPDSTGWLGGPDPDAESPEQRTRLPVRPGAYQGPVTPPDVYGGVKQEPREGE